MGFNPPADRLPIIYVSVFDGNLTTRAKPNEEGAVERENKEGRKVWEHHHKDGLTGILLNITAAKNPRINKNPWEYLIEMRDNKNKFVIAIPAESRYGDDLACKVPAIKYGVSTVINPYHFTDKDNKEKKIIGVTIMQEGTKVPRCITKENPMGRPETDGQLDDDDYKAFKIKERKFYREIVQHHSNTLTTQEEVKVSSAATQTSSDQPPAASGEEDDLPF